MNSPDSSDIAPADDGFGSYYAEKLWAWIPEVYRTEDLEGPAPGALRALIEVIASQAAVIRRDVDRVWDDQSVELADDWVLPYIADLLATRPVSEFNTRGQRVATAKTIHYRRRKGTATVIQQLIRDIGDLDGLVIEAFRRLGRTPHRLDLPGDRPPGRITATPPGGLANMRAARTPDIAGGPFDDLAHMPDVRRLRGPYGRFGIPKVNLHLYTLDSFPVLLATPVEIDTDRFTIDPSGRAIDLYQSGRPAPGDCAKVHEWEVPAPLTCRRFNAAHYLMTAEALSDRSTSVQTRLAPTIGNRYRSEGGFRSAMDDRLTAPQMSANIAHLLDATMTADTPKANLWPESIELTIGEESADDPLAPSAVIAADLTDWAAALSFQPEKAVALDPARGLLRRLAAAPAGDLFVNRYHYGFSAEIGAGPYPRAASLSEPVTANLPAGPLGAGGGFDDPGPVGGFALQPNGVFRFTTSRTYVPTLPAPARIAGISALALEADDGQRPYVMLRPPDAATPVVLEAASLGPGDGNTLVIDGLWLGLRPLDETPLAVADADTPAPPVTLDLVLEDAFDRVIIRHCTLDPGGEQARSDPTLSLQLPAIRLSVNGFVGRLEISRSIVGPVHEVTPGADECGARDIVIADSIVQSRDPAVAAIQTRIAAVKLDRVTVFGDVLVNRLDASDSLIQGLVRVADNQHGCFRFSSTGRFESQPNPVHRPQLPRQFEAFLFPEAVPNHVFRSRRFGDSRFAALSATAPRELLRGASNRCEMGAFNGRLLAVRQADLETKVLEYLPFGLLPQSIRET
jgi:hypothetical protein